jgi:hypothetical protein
MNLTDPQPGGQPHGEPARVKDARHPAVLRLAHRVGHAFAEAHHAQRRMAQLHGAYDRYLPEPNLPPEDYAEFLLRTSGPLRHEPSARQRLAGRAVR